ncbi:MAG: hypothetical protein IPJ26_14860 [Bacteroidetes bacterium]|nr:hypothetical protein [Bacteroidota bacterium]
MTIQKRTSKSLTHACHNHDACLELDKLLEYNDWVITTAFYSALHYVDHSLFPDQFEIKGKESRCTCFEEYISKKSKGAFVSPHALRLDLVFLKLEDIGSSYKTLFDLCKTARYKNFKMSIEDKNIALYELKNIKEFCVEVDLEPLRVAPKE